jgi:hypothetical protein
MLNLMMPMTIICVFLICLIFCDLSLLSMRLVFPSATCILSCCFNLEVMPFTEWVEDFDIHNWPVSSEAARHELEMMVETHRVVLIPAYDLKLLAL